MPKSQAVTKTMQGNKGKDSKPELLLRKALWDAGVRGYRLHRKDLPGKPDLVFPAKKLVVFVHGCYWHSCPICAIARPRHNATYWNEKLSGNSRRDAAHTAKLAEAGWRVHTVWECQVKSSLSEAVQHIQDLLADNG
ncbi:very short patch repair endonuclease [Hymenobacter gummosus]|uniref:Very short patch repair endonuclease n=1 Tax=Hymenobacter gummosus TaxID=1776032 RepID=A0A3S0J6F1_9BACT|nr:very short patch repair endonuclease [Hymenobacter gummosus]RTQ45843.1 very short patch repair endonuclease [Hymenobacter gummosus]